MAVDYGTRDNLAFWLGKLFWADLEHHHPGIDSLHLAPDVAADWKKRVLQRTDRSGEVVARANCHIVMSTVRRFYLDLRDWAQEDPARWAPWVAPCPISRADLASRWKHQTRVKAKMQGRTRTLAEYVAPLVATARSRLADAEALLAAVQAGSIDDIVFIGNCGYRIARATGRSGPHKVAVPLDGGRRLNPVTEEAEAFWAWAAIETLRLSGLRVEEFCELTHLSIRRYTQPDGTVIPLLQVAPSKMDTERVFPISPELAHVLARIVARVRAGRDVIQNCPRWDTHEKVWGPPLPHLIQVLYGGQPQVFDPSTVRAWLNRTAERAGLVDVDGQPVRFMPHDFRRLFTTDVVNAGLPIHIAAAILGHGDLDTTRGYTAVYPDEVIRAYQAFIAHRRRMRPIAEYREPTETEWTEFEQHFALRDVAYGKCDRPYGSSCIHEHACVRCPMLRPLPSRLPVLREVEANLAERIAEAEERVWLGEVKGLQDTLEALREKTARLEQLTAVGVTDTPASMV